jgi:hypothetical protein
VLNLERKWLATVPWQKVVAQNLELCQKDQQPHEQNPKGYDAAKQLWEKKSGETMPLRQALDVFRQVHKLAPFKFFNGNTVAAAAREMMAQVVGPLPSLQAEMARRTVGHYVVGAVKAAEVDQVLQHVAGMLNEQASAPAGLPGSPGAASPPNNPLPSPVS